MPTKGAGPPESTPLRFEQATPADAAPIAALRNAVAAALTASYGRGWWSGQCTDKGVLFDLRVAKVYLLRRLDKIVATVKLAERKPWAIDRRAFTPGKRPLYLTAMAVAPAMQHQGIGRFCLAKVDQVAREWPAEAVCLDAFDHAAGAGEFYRRCGYREVARARYRMVPLIYFEKLV